MPRSRASTSAALAQQARRTAHALAAQYRLIKASFGAVRRTCGKASCRCRQGFRHEAWAFTYKRHGRSRCLHVPQDLVPAARQAAAAYVQAKQLLQRLSDLNLRRFTRQIQTRRTPSRPGRVSRRGER